MSLTQRIDNKSGFIIYYDPEIFTQDILLSISLLQNNTDRPGYHWNKIFPQYNNNQFPLGIKISSLPPLTKIMGAPRVKTGTIRRYFLPNDYDPSGDFTYKWSVISGVGNITTPNTGKSVDIEFPSDGVTDIMVEIYNGHCKRTHTLQIVSGVKPQKMLIVNYPSN